MSKLAFENAEGRQTVFLFDPDVVKIVDDKDHPLFQPHRTGLPFDENLVRSIMFNGFKSIVKVRKDGPHVLIVDGRQRTVAAREANRRLREQGKEPVRLLAYQEKGDDADMAGLMILANHGGRTDSPMEEARELKKFLDLGRTVEQAASVFVCKVSHIEQLRTLLGLSPKVQKAVESGMSITAAARLAKFSREEQEQRLEKAEAEGGKVTVSRMARAVKTKDGSTDGPQAPKRKSIQAVVDYLKTHQSGAGAVAAEALEWVLGGSVPNNGPIRDAVEAATPKAAAPVSPAAEAA